MCCVKCFKSALLYPIVTQAGAGSRKSIEDCNIMIGEFTDLMTLALLGPILLFKPL